MSHIISVGTSIPEFNLSQGEVKEFVQSIFPRSQREVERLLPVFENANIKNRQFVVEQPWFKENHTFEERNRLYQDKAIELGCAAIDDCLRHTSFLNTDVPKEAIDAIIFVSSTGLATPSIDAHIINEMRLRDDIVRMPLWGLGCAGGASGLARAHDWLKSNSRGCVLVVCVELCSLTFQKDDGKKSNFIGTALFGDGISAALLVGDQSPYVQYRKNSTPKITSTSSRMKKDSLDVMGWDFTDNGFEVIFARSIPQLVRSFWSNHVNDFLQALSINKAEIPFYIAHPGGKKVLDAMEAELDVSADAFHHSYKVLEQHGNMSSSTVLHVLGEWMKESIVTGEKSILSALGPGFSSELISVEWS